MHRLRRSFHAAGCSSHGEWQRFARHHTATRLARLRLAGAAPLTPSLTSGRPVLLVGNHQLIGPDISMIVDEIYASTGVLMRG